MMGCDPEARAQHSGDEDAVIVNRRLNVEETALARFCDKHHVGRLSLFGSHLNGTARADSDVDLLVEFDAEHVPTLLGISAMERELSEMLGGRPVDLRTAQDLSRYFRDEVVRMAEVQYAR
jgi:hypothetical protein